MNNLSFSSAFHLLNSCWYFLILFVVQLRLSPIFPHCSPLPCSPPFSHNQVVDISNLLFYSVLSLLLWIYSIFTPLLSLLVWFQEGAKIKEYVQSSEVPLHIALFFLTFWVILLDCQNNTWYLEKIWKFRKVQRRLNKFIHNLTTHKQP